jgi:hypothetical protein
MPDDPWDRPSIVMKSRPTMAVRNVSRRDLLLPKGPSKLRVLGLTLVGGLCMALLYVWPPLMIVVIVSGVSLGTTWFWVTIACAAVVLWMALFTLAMRESAADRRYAEQLHLPG